MNKTKSENVLSHPRDKKAEHDYLSDPKFVAFDTCIGNLVWELRNAQRALSEYKTTIPKIDSPDERIYYMKTREYLETINVDMHKLEGKVREAQEELSGRAERRTRIAKFRKSQHKDIP